MFLLIKRSQLSSPVYSPAANVTTSFSVAFRSAPEIPPFVVGVTAISKETIEPKSATAKMVTVNVIVRIGGQHQGNNNRFTGKLVKTESENGEGADLVRAQPRPRERAQKMPERPVLVR